MPIQVGATIPLLWADCSRKKLRLRGLDADAHAEETLSRMLKRAKLPHSVLNAKYHRQEAEIVTRAGHKGSITVSTNMAGRGTDIKLEPGVPDVGGLMVVGTAMFVRREQNR